MARLYALTDEALLSREEFFPRVEEALCAGIRMIQLREKESTREEKLLRGKKLKKLCEIYDATLIINDDIAVAREIGAEGVHLGRNDETLERAREQLGPEAIIGVSCYNDLALAQDAIARGASYVAFGSVFASPTKPGAARVEIETLQEAKNSFSVDICAIGGITPGNVGAIKNIVDIVAVNSALWTSPDVSQTVKNFFEQEEK